MHLGITEAGGKRTGSIKSSIGMGDLLLNDIGDTIRVSLSDEPEEETVGYEILQKFGIKEIECKNYFLSFVTEATISVIETVKNLREN